MKTLLLILISLLLLLGCGTSNSNDSQEEIIFRDPYSDPPGITGNPFVGYGEVSSIDLPAPTNDDVSIDLIQIEHQDGPWSVQVAACATENAAKSLRDTLAASTQYPVFIDHVGSYYKVRVGAFQSSGATDELRVSLRANGYPDAWSVER